jgi:hypothetical protein
MIKYRASLKDEVKRLISTYESSCSTLERQVGTPSKLSLYGPKLLQDIKQARRFIKVNSVKTTINHLSVEALESLVSDLTDRVSVMETHISNEDAFKYTVFKTNRQVGKSQIAQTMIEFQKSIYASGHSGHSGPSGPNIGDVFFDTEAMVTQMYTSNGWKVVEDK